MNRRKALALLGSAAIAPALPPLPVAAAPLIPYVEPSAALLACLQQLHDAYYLSSFPPRLPWSTDDERAP